MDKKTQMNAQMKAWIVEQHGGSEALQQKELPIPSPEAGQARVRVVAAGLNHLDLWVRNGVPGHHFPLPLILGCDLTGTIESFGSLASDQKEMLASRGLKEGSDVLVYPVLSCGQCALCARGDHPLCTEFGIIGETRNGGFSDYAVVPVQNLIARPKEISPEEAAALPIAYITAWNMLTKKAKVQPGETVLVQAGGSGVSIAAIQMAKFLGATVFTTVGSDAKAEKAKALGADYVLNYKEKKVREEMKPILKQLGRRGVDVVIDHVGEDTFQESFKLLAWGGRLVTCGATSGSKVEIDLKPLFFKSLSILGSTMGSLSDLMQVVELVRLGKLKSVIDSVFPMNQLPEALSKLEKREAFGKVVVRN